MNSTTTRTFDNEIAEVKAGDFYVYRGDYRLIVESPDGEIHHYGIHATHWTFPGYAEMLEAKRRQGKRNPTISRSQRAVMDAQYTRERVFELFREKCLDNTRVALIYHSYQYGKIVMAEKKCEENSVEYLPGGDAGMFPAAHPRPTQQSEDWQTFEAWQAERNSWLLADDEDTPRPGAGGGNPDADLDDAEYSAHLDNCALTHAIQDQAYMRHFAAAHLAAKAVEDGYSGGMVIAGVGDFGLDTALYTVIYEARGKWQLYAGYQVNGETWITVQCAQHRDVKALRWIMSFTHNARLCEVNPAEVAVSK